MSPLITCEKILAVQPETIYIERPEISLDSLEIFNQFTVSHISPPPWEKTFPAMQITGLHSIPGLNKSCWSAENLS